MTLTRRQREVLDHITAFIQDRRYSPSLQEIADHFGFSSPATIHKHVTNLITKGYLTRDWNRSRSIDVVGQAPRPVPMVHPCPTCGTMLARQVLAPVGEES